MTSTTDDDKEKMIPKSLHDLQINQLRIELTEYQEFFNLFIKLLDKHGINPRDFHDGL